MSAPTDIPKKLSSTSSKYTLGYSQGSSHGVSAPINISSQRRNSYMGISNKEDVNKELDSSFLSIVQSPSYSRNSRYLGPGSLNYSYASNMTGSRDQNAGLNSLSSTEPNVTTGKIDKKIPSDRSKKDSNATPVPPSSAKSKQQAAPPSTDLQSKSSQHAKKSTASTATTGIVPTNISTPGISTGQSSSATTTSRGRSSSQTLQSTSGVPSHQAKNVVISGTVNIATTQNPTQQTTAAPAAVTLISPPISSTGSANYSASQISAPLNTSIIGNIGGIPHSIHPAIGKLGLLYSKNLIMGSNTRCIAMLHAFKQFIGDYRTPPSMALSRHLDSQLKPLINYLVGCRPLSVSMGNAIRHLKCEIANLPLDDSEDEAKEKLYDIIDAFIRDRIYLADQLIIHHGCTKIQDDDVILIYAKSTVLLELLKEAHRQGKRFRVIVADSRPWFEGQESCRILKAAGLPITYILLNAIGYVIPEVTKIFIGVHCVYSNGTVLSRIGTCLVAMTGYDHKIPVIVCCETYKFSDRVQLETSCASESADPNLMKSPSGSILNQTVATESGTTKAPKSQEKVSKGSKESSGSVPTPNTPALLNLMHDITPSKYISMIITEIGMIPTTSVPVVLREYRSSNVV